MKENIIKFPSNVYNLDVYRAKKKKKSPAEVHKELIKGLFDLNEEEAEEWLKNPIKPYLP